MNAIIHLRLSYPYWGSVLFIKKTLAFNFIHASNPGTMPCAMSLQSIDSAFGRELDWFWKKVMDVGIEHGGGKKIARGAFISWAMSRVVKGEGG